MSFGIAPAPEEFQQRIHDTLTGLPCVEAIADDILVWGEGDSLDEATKHHEENLLRLLNRAREKHLKFNKDKLHLHLPEVTYITHVFADGKVKADPEKIAAIMEMPTPTKPVELQRFLGMVNYLAKFLPHLSTATEPLRRLLDQDSIWSWLPNHDKAYNDVKPMLSRQPTLRCYDVNVPVTIQCDVSDKGLGAALLQGGQPVAYASRALTSTEQNYAQIEKEMLAIVFAAGRFDQYVYGTTVKV